MTSSEYRKLAMLLSNIKSGSRDAFAGIYTMYEKKVYFLFCKILKSKSLAKQMTIEFFDYVYMQTTSFGNAAVFEKWLYNSLFSKCRRYLIDNQPQLFGEYIDSDSDDGEAIDDILAQDSDEMLMFPDGIDISVDMMQTVDSILSELPLKLRTAVLLYWFCGFEYADIAATEQISVTAVKNRLMKAHIRLETEEHKYSEIGYDCAGMVIFMPDVLSSMAENIVIPADITSGVTSRTGVNCLEKTIKFIDDASLENTAYINITRPVGDKNYVTTYATQVRPPKQSIGQDISPAVKILMTIIALLVIIGGAVAIFFAVQSNNNEPESVVNNDNIIQQTTVESTTVPETTTEAETTKEPETTTEAETTTQPETTTVPETTTQPTTVPTTVPTTEATTQPTTAPPVIEEPENEDVNIEIDEVIINQ